MTRIALITGITGQDGAYLAGYPTGRVFVANRITNDIRDVADKVYSRDLFEKD